MACQELTFCNSIFCVARVSGTELLTSDRQVLDVEAGVVDGDRGSKHDVTVVEQLYVGLVQFGALKLLWNFFRLS